MTRPQLPPLIVGGEPVYLDGRAVAAELGARAQHYAAQQVRPRTEHAYRRAVRQFAAWAAASSRDPWQPAAVADYIAGRRDATCSAATLRQDRAAIAAAYRATGRPSPMTAAVAAVAAGAHRDAAAAPRQALPLRRDAWAAAALALADEAQRARTAPARLRAARDRAMLVLGWLMLARRSELLSLRVRDVEVSAEGLAVTIPQSKRSDTPETVHLPAGRSRATDPADAWAELRRLDPSSPSSPAWPTGRGRLGPSSGHELGRIIRRALAMARVPDAGRYSAHSLRRGPALELAERGAPLTAIADAGRWSSIEMVARYARQARGFLDSPLAVLDY